MVSKKQKSDAWHAMRIRTFEQILFWLPRLAIVFGFIWLASDMTDSLAGEDTTVDFALQATVVASVTLAGFGALEGYVIYRKNQSLKAARARMRRLEALLKKNGIPLPSDVGR